MVYIPISDIQVSLFMAFHQRIVSTSRPVRSLFSCVGWQFSFFIVVFAGLSTRSLQPRTHLSRRSRFGKGVWRHGRRQKLSHLISLKCRYVAQWAQGFALSRVFVDVLMPQDPPARQVLWCDDRPAAVNVRLATVASPISSTVLG